MEAASYKVCYQFQSEPRFALTTFSLNAFAVAVSHFENDAIVVADVNTVVASGYGLSAEDRLLVSMTEACSADWSFVPTVEEATRLTFAVSIPASYARLHLCYKFSTGDVVSLHYAFRASTIKSSNLERVVNRVLTTASFEGPMEGDRIAIVASGEACDSTEYQFTLSEMLRISGVITFPGLIPAYADVCYAVNSKWVRMFTVPVLGLSNIVPESVVANYEYSFFVNATHITGECEASKLPFAESWVNYGCDFTNNLYTGRVENIFDDSEDAPAVRLGGMGSNACSSRLGPNGNYIVLDLGSCFDVTKITIATEDSSSDVNTWRVLAAADSNMLFSEVLFSDNDNHVSVGLNEKELEFSGRLMKLEFLTNRGHPLYTTIRKIALYGHACAASPDFALKYVAPSAACAAPGEEIAVSTCSQRFIKAFDVSFDEKKVCFKHPAYPQFVEYPDITMQLKYISGLAGSNKLAVGGSRFAQLVGKGVETGDELKFVHQGMTCEDAMPVLTVMGTSTVLLQGFTEVGTYTLCYKFVNSIDSFMAYPDVTLEVEDPSIFRVEPTYAFVNQPEELSFFGKGISEADVFKIIPTNLNCNEESAYPQHAVNAEGKATVTFTEPITGKVCYRWGLATEFVDTGLLFEVYLISSVQPAVFVNEVPEPVTFSGVGITVNDAFAFVPAGTPCAEATLVYSMSDAAVDVVAGEVQLTKTVVLTAAEETVMDVCYKLKVTGAFHVLPFQVRVIPNTITMHNVEDAEDLFYVNNAMSSFIVRGPAVGREDEALRVLSAHATSCEDMSQLLAEVPAVRQAEQYAKVTFQVNSETSELKVCYKFGALGFRLMSVAIPVLKVTSVFKGDAVLNAVYVDSTNTFEAEGFNLQTGDKMKFVDRMGQAEYSCLSSGDALHGQPEVTLTLNDKGRTEGAFRFTEPGLNLAMCYYFAAHNKHVLFPAIQVDVLEVKYESEDVAIMGYPYSMEFTGAGQSAGDRVMWMKGDAVACDPMSDAVVSSVEILNEYKKVTFVFGSVYRGLKLCVKKAIDEDWTLLTQYSLDVLGVTAMAVPAFEEWEEESRSRVLANLDAEIFFNDHDEGDKAKFVSADRACESDMGVCGLMTVGEAHNATLNCRPAEEVVLCYYFARAQQWVKYENKKLRVAGPSGVTLEKEVIGDDLVAHMTVSGVDVASDCAHVEVTKDEAFLRALEVSSNDATLTRSDIMAALGNTQYGLSSESGHPLELTFTAPTAFSIAAIWIHAAKQDISPRTVEVYRKEEGAMVLAFRYTTTYAANQAEMSPLSDFNGVSTTWTISIVDTLLAEREEANETLAPFTYFTGLDIISSSGAERSDVDVKFVAAEEDCSAASAMLDHRTGAVMEVARLNACTGVLAPFTVADYSKTYKMCYAQRSAPDGYSEYVAYDELSFAFRYTTVSAAGAATFAMAGVDKALSLTASTGEAITKVLFVPYAGACEVSFASSGPFMVENGEVTVRFTKDQDAMRLCVMYGDEEVYEPQRFVMSVGYIEVVAYAAAWTVYEPYVLTVEGRYLNANNRVVDS